MKPSFSSNRLWPVLALLGAALFAPPPLADDKDKTVAGYYKDAVARYEQADYKAAAIQLKNALQLDPKLPQARVLLGLALLKQDNGAGAEEELLKAEQLGADRAATGSALAKAYLLQYRYSDLLAKISAEGYGPEARAEVLTSRGHAYMELRDYARAAQEFEKAARANPKSAEPWSGLATLQLRQGDWAEASRLAGQAVALAPRDAGAWNVKASISHASGLPEQAVQEYGRVLESSPKHYPARLARASLLLELGRTEAAVVDLDRLRAQVPYEPRANFLYSEAMARLNAPEAARAALADAATIIDAMAPEVLSANPPVMLVGGFANYRLKHSEKARAFLSRYLAVYPRDLSALELLATIHLEGKDPAQVIARLKPALAWAPNDLGLLSLLSVAYLQKGQHQNATELLEKAVDLSGGAADLKAQLAFSKLGNSKQQAEAIADLYKVLEQDNQQAPAALALVLLHMKRGEPAKAQAAAQRLAAIDPGNPAFLNLLATAQMANGDQQAARENYQKAIAAQPGFLAARINLGTLNRKEGKPAEAAAMLATVLKDQPGQVQALLEMARLEAARGHLPQALAWAEKARAANAGSVEAHLSLARLYLALRRPAEALNMVQDAEVLKPGAPEVLALNSECQMAMGKPKVAQSVLQTLSRAAGFDADWLLRTARMQLAAGAVSDAIWSLVKAVQGNPESLAAREALTEAYLLDGQLEKAEESASALQSQFPGEAVTWGVLGDVSLRQGHYQEAAAHYRKAHEQRPGTWAVIRLYQALSAAGNRAGGLAELEPWAKAHPDDPDAAQALAEAYLANGRLPEAKERYEQALKQRPGNPATLNNLANILFKLGDPKAIDYAREALVAAPGNPAINDTLGWLLVQQGDPVDGLSHLRDAQSRAAANPGIRYHLAAALDRLGRRDEALAELDGLLKSQQAFDDVAEAKALHKKLAPR
jgi:putative PEP-CTERM system TPR-repeat lipoprotein